jgi:hypothetical protein
MVRDPSCSVKSAAFRRESIHCMTSITNKMVKMYLPFFSENGSTGAIDIFFNLCSPTHTIQFQPEDCLEKTFRF